jgi:hypothetical protein
VLELQTKPSATKTMTVQILLRQDWRENFKAMLVRRILKPPVLFGLSIPGEAELEAKKAYATLFASICYP